MCCILPVSSIPSPSILGLYSNFTPGRVRAIGREITRSSTPVDQAVRSGPSVISQDARPVAARSPKPVRAKVHETERDAEPKHTALAQVSEVCRFGELWPPDVRLPTEREREKISWQCSRCESCSYLVFRKVSDRKRGHCERRALCPEEHQGNSSRTGAEDHGEPAMRHWRQLLRCRWSQRRGDS